MEPERRPVTILFADLVGFTAFTERAGEEAAYVLMEAVHRLISRVIRSHGGTIKEATGDGIIALFGVPMALEDGALRACRAALSIQERLAAPAEELEAVRAARPRLRISIDSGVVIVGSAEEGAGFAVFGDTVNTAARLQAMAPPGAILLSEGAHRLVRGLVAAEFVGLYPLKGKIEPQPAYRLDAVREGAPRFSAALARRLSPYSGRARELERLESILGGGRRRLRIVDIVGEPGIGKSRLLHEFFGRSAATGALLTGSCSPEGRSVPFLPLLDIVRRCVDIAPDDRAPMVARKACDGLAALGLHSPQNLALLLKLAGFDVPPGALDGVPVERRLRDLLLRLLEARCRRSPLILLLEDLQWIDGASEELLTRLVDTADTSQLALVHTRRPEYLPPWVDHPRAKTLRLGPLADAEIRRIARDRLGVAPPEDLARVVAERAAGNPFFAEEIAGAVLERGVLRPGAERPEYDAAAAADALPAAVQALLAARIDGLDRRDRAILRGAAAIGRRFDVEILAAVIGDDGRLGRRLAALEALGLLKPAEVSGAFAFAHPLMRDMLYESLLAPQRAALHLKIAVAIERRSSDRRIEATEIVVERRVRQRGGTGPMSSPSARPKRARAYCLKDAEQHFARALEVAAAFPFATAVPVSATPPSLSDVAALREKSQAAE